MGLALVRIGDRRSLSEKTAFDENFHRSGWLDALACY